MDNGPNNKYSCLIMGKGPNNTYSCLIMGKNVCWAMLSPLLRRTQLQLVVVIVVLGSGGNDKWRYNPGYFRGYDPGYLSGYYPSYNSGYFRGFDPIPARRNRTSGGGIVSGAVWKDSRNSRRTGRRRRFGIRLRRRRRFRSRSRRRRRIFGDTAGTFADAKNSQHPRVRDQRRNADGARVAGATKAPLRQPLRPGEADRANYSDVDAAAGAGRRGADG